MLSTSLGVDQPTRCFVDAKRESGRTFSYFLSYSCAEYLRHIFLMTFLITCSFWNCQIRSIHLHYTILIHPYSCTRRNFLSSLIAIFASPLYMVPILSVYLAVNEFFEVQTCFLFGFEDISIFQSEVFLHRSTLPTSNSNPCSQELQKHSPQSRGSHGGDQGKRASQ